MAARYWVGGTASWDATAGTKWALTDGGAGGQAVPTSADDVFFTALSGAVTVTAASAQSCLALNFTGFTGTFTGTATLSVSGSITLSAGLVWSYTGNLVGTSPVSPVATNTLTSVGKTLANFNVNANSGSSWQLGDALTLSGALTVTAATFTTNNFNVTASSLQSSNSNTRTINLGSSTVTVSATSPWNFGSNTNLTFNAGTSTIVCSSATTVSFVGGGSGGAGVTFYNLSFTGTSVGTKTFQGVNTFNNMTVSGPASAGVVQVSFGDRQTINGTLSTTGTAGNRRVLFQGATYGIAQTLTINSAPSLTDADFRDIYVIGTAAPISGTRIGDLRGIRGITASTPKTVYWNLAAGGNWSATAWAATSGGAVSTDNFPLAQDTAVIENTGLNTSATVTVDSVMSSVAMSGVDMSTRTNAMTFATGSVTFFIYGDWKNGAGTTLSGTGAITFSGRNTQRIVSAGKSFGIDVTIDSFDGSVELDGALTFSSLKRLTVTNGTFNTKGYNLSLNSIASTNSNIRKIVLGNSTVTLDGSSNTVNFATSTNLTLDAGTSTIILSYFGGSHNFGTNLTFYNVLFTATAGSSAQTITGTNPTFFNLSLAPQAATGIYPYNLTTNCTITGTLTCAGATAVRRVFVRSDTLGTTRTLTVGTLSAQDCDFRDITIAGTAAGSSPTRAGDCGGNTGITFPAAKTVYWNLAGTQNWSATAWAPSSGGTPALNNFPLAQDTAVFDNTGAAGTITVDAAWNIGTFDASLRTSAMTINAGNGAPFCYGNWTLGTGVTSGAGGTVQFAGRGVQTVTSNGTTFNSAFLVDCVTGTVQLADALTLNSARTLTLTSGTFDAVTYNVTTGLFNSGNSNTRTLKMGSGTWTISGTASIWDFSTTTNLAFYKGTANITLSDTSTSARVFTSGGLSYNKLTIGGTTGTSTLTISGNNQFTELASTKTVAHTIALGTNTQTFGAWTVTGTAGNVVTLTGTGTSHILAGACTSGIDYLAMGSIGFAATSPGEFYAGANSTATGAAAPLYLTAKPADSTRYWVGGTGNWSDTARWSTSSGGASGASVPRSHDDVVFNSASNATAYTATVNAVTGGIRCKALTIAGPASGNVTLAGSTAINGIHGNVTLPATGLTRTYTGAITLSGSATGRTFTSNGVLLSNDVVLNGVNCGWALGGALNLQASAVFTLTNGSFDTAGYSFTLGRILSSNTNSRTLSLGASTLTLNGLSQFLTFTTDTNLTFNAGTSTINVSVINSNLTTSSGQTFYDVNFNYTASETTGVSINGANTFNNLSIAGLGAAGMKPVTLSANQTINGTLTLSAGTNATMRTFVRSDTIGTTRTLICAAVSATDVDFRDITIAGAAAPVSGTRLGDCKGNSGITFDAPKTVYYSSTAGNWGTGTANGVWSLTNGGAATQAAFPLAQDTAVFPSSPTPFPSSGNTATINAAYNIGTIDMSARTSNTMTLATGTTAPQIYNNWINGTGTTLSGTGTLTFAGRGSQTITSAGKTFTQPITINSPSGAVTLQDAFICSFSSANAIFVDAGTFALNSYSASFTVGGITSSGTLAKTLSIGSGTLFLGAGGAAFGIGGATNLTVTGTGTISLTSASAKTFSGGGISYSGITLNQGGAGTLTISGNNTFANISNTFKATGATNITLGTTTQRVGNFTAAGEAGRGLTVQGTSAASPATLVFTGSGQATTPTTDYLAITGVRAYDLTTTWYAGANSTNNGSLGWYFEAGGGGPIAVFITESSTAADAQSSIATLYSAASETTTASDAAAAGLIYIGTLSESATASDVVEAVRAYFAAIAEAVTSADLISASLTFAAAVAELTTASDSTAVSSRVTLPSIAEVAQAADALSGGLLFLSNISEVVNPADTTAALLVVNRAIFESLNANEATQVAASTFGAVAAETAQPLDTAQGANTGSSSLSESAVASEADSTAFAPFTAISEQATAQEAEVATAVFQGTLAETSTGADQSSVAPSNFSAVALAVAQAVDSQNAPGSIYNAALPIQGAGAYDSLRRVKLRTVFIDDFVYTGADTTALTVDATVSGNTASGTVESGQITATVLP